MFKCLKKKTGTMLGVHINATSLNILEISDSSGQYCVEGYGYMQLPQQSIGNANVIVQCLKSLLSRSKFSSRQTVLAVPDSCVISKILQISIHVLEQDMEECVMMLMEKYIPYPMDEISLDFNVIGPSVQKPEQWDVLVVASRTEDIDQRVEMLHRAGLMVQIMDVESYAIERAMRLWAGATEQHSVLFDLDGMFLRCFVFNGQNIIFSREDVLSDLSNFADWLQQMKRTLQFFQASFPHIFIEQIVLAGNLTILDQLKLFLQTHFTIPIHLANPFSQMRCATKELEILINRDAPMLMTTCGLALRK